MPDLNTYLPLIILFGSFYFFLLRPQQKQRKQRTELLANLQKGDKVITIGGIHGTIVDLREDTMKIKVADNVELKMGREAVGTKLN